MSAGATWSRNPNPQPGDFSFRRSDGLLMTVVQRFLEGSVEAVQLSRRDSVPSIQDVESLVPEVFPTVEDLVMSVKSGSRGDSHANAVYVLRETRVAPLPRTDLTRAIPFG